MATTWTRKLTYTKNCSAFFCRMLVLFILCPIRNKSRWLLWWQKLFVRQMLTLCPCWPEKESRWVDIVKDVIANLGLDQLLDNTTSISIKPLTWNQTSWTKLMVSLRVGTKKDELVRNRLSLMKPQCLNPFRVFTFSAWLLACSLVRLPKYV